MSADFERRAEAAALAREEIQNAIAAEVRAVQAARRKGEPLRAATWEEYDERARAHAEWAKTQLEIRKAERAASVVEYRANEITRRRQQEQLEDELRVRALINQAYGSPAAAAGASQAPGPMSSRAWSRGWNANLSEEER